MARRKLPSVPALTSWDDVDDAMRQIISQDNTLTGLQTQLDADVEVLQNEYKEQAKPLQDAVKLLGSQIKQFVTANRTDLGDKKTKELLHGKTGFRYSTKCVVPKGTDEQVAAALEAMGLADCVNTKKTVNKEQLRKQPNDVVAQAGARIETEDTFWFEVNHASLEAPDE